MAFPESAAELAGENPAAMKSNCTAGPGRQRTCPRGRPITQSAGLANSAQTAGAGPTCLGLRLAFSVKETAEILGVSEKTVRRLINRKLLRASRALRHLRIAKKEIERFVDDTTVP